MSKAHALAIACDCKKIGCVGATLTCARVSRTPRPTELRPAANAAVRGAEPWVSCAGVMHVLYQMRARRDRCGNLMHMWAHLALKSLEVHGLMRDMRAVLSCLCRRKPATISVQYENFYVVRSNNLHELRRYNRAMLLAAVFVVVLRQDDDRR